MAETALPLKYRPDTFEKVIGQDSLVNYCSELIRRGQKGKNMVIAGPYGSGKTTTARIYAKALNCLHVQADGSPCLECEHCLQFGEDGKGFADYREFDGATRGGTVQIKEELEIAKQPPMFGKWRIFVIDEAQGVSRQGFDAMLKVVEEPPPFLVFIFLTTEADKIRKAIKSRCANLEVKLLDAPTAIALLQNICEKEGFAAERQALELITHVSQGHPRDLVKNLEQVSEFGEGITLELTKTVFSLGYTENLVQFTRALLDRDVTRQVQAIRDWADVPQRKRSVIAEFFLFLYYREVLKAQITVNPVFDFIPELDRRQIMVEFRKRADSNNSTIELTWTAINKFWAEAAEAYTEPALEYLLLTFNNLVNVNNFTSTKMSTTRAVTAGDRMTAPSRVNRTERITTQNQRIVQPAAPTPSVQPQTPPAEIELHRPEPAPLPTKVFAHNLPQHGFSTIIPAEEVTFDDL